MPDAPTLVPVGPWAGRTDGELNAECHPSGATDLHPYDVARDRAAAIAICQRTQGITSVWHSPDDSADGVLWLRGGPSWATTIDATHSPPYPSSRPGAGSPC
jgi:hypothetical protein